MFIVEIESFTWISLYEIITHDIVYAMMIYNNWIMYFFFVNLNFVILLNKMCYVDDDKFGWDSGWLDRVVKWYKKCKYDIVDNLEPQRNSAEISMDFFKKKFLKFLVTCYYFFYYFPTLFYY